METNSMGLTTGRRPVPDYLDPKQDCILVRGPGGILGVMAVKPKPSAPLNNYNCPWHPDRQIGHSNFCQCYSMKKDPVDLICKEQFCKLPFKGNPGQDFCSFDCEMWHEALCK
jgi:hypothetical protein